jgi:5-methylcytosine-specific restriction endonuclease McrA
MKKCSKCGIEKAFNCFNKDKSKKDGLRPQCKDCRKEYREQNKEKAKDFYEANKDKIKDYYKQNKDRLLQAQKDFYEANKDKIKEYQKEYQKEYRQTERGKLVYKLKSQKRRTLKRELPNTLTKEEWLETLKHFNHSCANCGSNESPIHIDHFVPLSSGEKGTTVTNCIPLCSRCNCSKGAKHPLEFFSEEKAREIIEYLYTRKPIT